MDVSRWRNTLTGLFLTVLAVQPWVGPRALEAQEIPKVGEAKLATFAKTFAEVSDVRDDFYDRFGRTYDDQGRQQLREAMDARIDEILQKNGLTREEYQRLNVVVSADAEQRAVFEKLLEEIRASSGSP